MEMENEPVVIPAILLSDGVIREAGTGKLSYIGVFSQWNVPQLPFLVAPFFITAHVANFRHGGREVPVTLRIEKPDGHALWSVEGKVGFPEKDLPAGLIVELPTPVVGLQIGEAGRYTVRVLIDGDEVGHRDTFVRLMPATSGGAR
jgi:hypothetical protein